LFNSFSESYTLLDFYSTEGVYLEITEDDDRFLGSTPFYSFGDSFTFQKFLFLRKSTFISFFIDNMIDVPICFKKSKSLKMRNSELPFLKFTNLLMRRGEREKTTRIVIRSFFLFFSTMKVELFESKPDVLH
jgi:hypothetical protein